MTNFAIHNGTTVVNVIVAASKEVAEAVTGMTAIETNGEPWVGWILANGVWVAPSEPDSVSEVTDTLSDLNNVFVEGTDG